MSSLQPLRPRYPAESRQQALTGQESRWARDLPSTQSHLVIPCDDLPRAPTHLMDERVTLGHVARIVQKFDNPLPTPAPPAAPRSSWPTYTEVDFAALEPDQAQLSVTPPQSPRAASLAALFEQALAQARPFRYLPYPVIAGSEAPLFDRQAVVSAAPRFFLRPHPLAPPLPNDTTAADSSVERSHLSVSEQLERPRAVEPAVLQMPFVLPPLPTVSSLSQNGAPVMLEKMPSPKATPQASLRAAAKIKATSPVKVASATAATGLKTQSGPPLSTKRSGAAGGIEIKGKEPTAWAAFRGRRTDQVVQALTSKPELYHSLTNPGAFVFALSQRSALRAALGPLHPKQRGYVESMILAIARDMHLEQMGNAAAWVDLISQSAPDHFARARAELFGYWQQILMEFNHEHHTLHTLRALLKVPEANFKQNVEKIKLLFYMLGASGVVLKPFFFPLKLLTTLDEVSPDTLDFALTTCLDTCRAFHVEGHVPHNREIIYRLLAGLGNKSTTDAKQVLLQWQGLGLTADTEQGRVGNFYLLAVLSHIATSEMDATIMALRTVLSVRNGVRTTAKALLVWIMEMPLKLRQKVADTVVELWNEDAPRNGSKPLSLALQVSNVISPQSC